MNDKKVYVLVSTCLVVSLISVGFAGFTYYKTSQPQTTNANKNKPFPSNLDKTYWDNWQKTDTISDYQKILNQASRYEHNPKNWHSPPSVSIGQGFGVEHPDYIIFKGSEDNIYAKSGDNGQIMYEDSDFQTVLQSAIDDLDANTQPGFGGTIFITEGQYTVTSHIELKHRVKLVGDGWWSTLLQLADNANDNLIQSVVPAGANERSGMGIRDMHLQGNKANNENGHCIALGSNEAGETPDDSWVERVWIGNAPQDAIHIENGHHNFFHTVVIGGPDNRGFYANDVRQNISQLYYFDGGAAAGPAFELGADADHCKMNIFIQNPANDGVLLDSSYNHGSIKVQQAGGYGLLLEGSYNTLSVQIASSSGYGIDIETPNNSISGSILGSGNSDVLLGGGGDSNYICAEYGDLNLSGGAVKNVINGRVHYPETIDMGGSSGVINPTSLGVETIPVYVDAGGAAVELQSIDTGIIHSAEEVKIIHTGEENITVVDDNANVAAPLKLSGNADLTLDNNGETIVFAYDFQDGVWREKWRNTQD